LMGFFLVSLAWAQVDRATQRPVPTVTAAVSSEGVRFTAPGNHVQIRLEVFSQAGTKLFHSEYQPGNELDWKLADETGQRIADGDYLCVVTVKSLSGEESQKLGTVTVGEKSISLQPTETGALSAAQAQALGAVENSSPLSVMPDNAAPAVTVTAH